MSCRCLWAAPRRPASLALTLPCSSVFRSCSSLLLRCLAPGARGLPLLSLPRCCGSCSRRHIQRARWFPSRLTPSTGSAAQAWRSSLTFSSNSMAAPQQWPRQRLRRAPSRKTSGAAASIGQVGRCAGAGQGALLPGEGWCAAVWWHAPHEGSSQPAPASRTCTPPEKEEDRKRLWAARHSAYYAAKALRPGRRRLLFPRQGRPSCPSRPLRAFPAHAHAGRPLVCLISPPLLPSASLPDAGCGGFPTDLCVPLSALTETVLAAQRLCRRHGLLAPLVGHVGDGK